jgi:hypothetical protein
MEKRIIYPDKETLASEDNRMPGLRKGENFFKREMSGGLA